MDPITGQGANKAAQAAATLAEAIRDASGYDESFCRDVEQVMCRFALPVSDACNARLKPPPPHVGRLLGAAARQQAAGGLLRVWLQSPGSVLGGRVERRADRRIAAAGNRRPCVTVSAIVGRQRDSSENLHFLPRPNRATRDRPNRLVPSCRFIARFGVAVLPLKTSDELAPDVLESGGLWGDEQHENETVNDCDPVHINVVAVGLGRWDDTRVGIWRLAVHLCRSHGRFHWNTTLGVGGDWAEGAAPFWKSSHRRFRLRQRRHFLGTGRRQPRR